MKADIIQTVLGLIGIYFAVAHEPATTASFLSGAFVVWALKRDDA